MILSSTLSVLNRLFESWQLSSEKKKYRKRQRWMETHLCSSPDAWLLPYEIPEAEGGQAILAQDFTGRRRGRERERSALECSVQPLECSSHPAWHRSAKISSQLPLEVVKSNSPLTGWTDCFSPRSCVVIFRWIG